TVATVAISFAVRALDCPAVEDPWKLIAGAVRGEVESRPARLAKLIVVRIAWKS
ncbi:hypothetical protein KI387_024167, partial [Taxus chinensis]